MKKDDIILIGRNMVHDALESGQDIEIIYIGKNSRHDPRIQEISHLAQKKNIDISYVTPGKLGVLSSTDKHQNIVAYMRKKDDITLQQILERKRQEKKDPFILLFNKLDYEQNLGAIIRSSWGADVDAIILSPTGVHSITPVVAKVSHGGAAYIPVISQSLFQAIETLKEYAIPVVGVEVGMGTPYDKLTLLGPVAFLFGGESSGISEPLTKKCDIFIHIPINNSLASLNISVATALVLFEKRRQERATK